MTHHSWEKRTSLFAVEGRLGNLKITPLTSQALNGGSQKRFDLKADQLIVLTKTHPPGIKRRTGVHFYPAWKRNSGGNGKAGSGFSRTLPQTGTFDLRPGYLCRWRQRYRNLWNCISYCPYDAISRQTENKLRIQVDHLTCEGCGACVSACPTSALQFTEPSPQEIYARMAALLESSKEKQGM
ncbi:MAG: hypothetical protein Ct9H300mP4_14460 [Gammaproteobacteria bacterium]|nr:MAG: hypothetical protein Ct9H300mP4_14460 [Gammaproteobacteria bacterium]